MWCKSNSKRIKWGVNITTLNIPTIRSILKLATWSPFAKQNKQKMKGSRKKLVGSPQIRMCHFSVYLFTNTKYFNLLKSLTFNLLTNINLTMQTEGQLYGLNITISYLFVCEKYKFQKFKNCEILSSFRSHYCSGQMDSTTV